MTITEHGEIEDAHDVIDDSAGHVSRTPIDKVACIAIAAGAAAIPLLLLVVQNGQQIGDRSLVFTTAIASASVAAIAVAVLQRVFGWREAALNVAAFSYTFFLNSWITGGQEMLLARSAIWLCTAVLATIAIRVLIGNSSLSLRLTSMAVMVAVSVLAVLGLTVDNNGETPTGIAFADIEPEQTPNVYVFVMDGLSRVDVLKRDFPGIDIDPALTRLDDLGFETSSISTANYARTHISIPSMLTGAYPSSDESPLDLGGEWSYATQTLSGNNQLVQTLANSGYEYWHAQSDVWGHANCSEAYADHCINQAGGDAETQAALWAMTPFGTTPFQSTPQSPVTVVDYVLANGTANDDPRLLFAHILSPHNPYKWDADCNSILVGSLVDGHQPEFDWMYKDETECLMRQLADSMERLTTADPNAIVLLLSDHGHSFSVNWKAGAWSDRDVDVRFSNFRSVRVPDRCRTDDPDGHSLINVNELIISCLTNTEPEWQEARFFTSSNDGVAEIPTKQRDQILLD